MQKNKLLQKLLAMFLIFVLTFADFALVTKSYAASFAETFFGTSSDTGHKNVEFEAFFGSDEDKSKEVRSDVNNKDLAMKFNLNVLDEGYLKNAKIEILESEFGKGLNFEIGKNGIQENSERIKTDEINQNSEEVNSEEIIQEENSDERLAQEINFEEVFDYTTSENENNAQNEELEIQNENTEQSEMIEKSQINENQNSENQEIIEENIEQNEVIEQINEDENDSIEQTKETSEQEIKTPDENLEQSEEISENETSNLEENLNEVEIKENAETLEETNQENIEQLEETQTEIEQDSEENIEQIENENEISNQEEPEIEFPAYVQSLEDNNIILDQINSTSNVKIDLPIKYKNEEYVSKDIVENSCKIRFSGIYVDGEGNEIEVEKEETLTVNWTDERELEVETGTTKYIDFGKGIILQTIIKTDGSEEGNRLPIRTSEINVEVPELGGVKPNNVLVVANSLEGTSGEKIGELNFNESNWFYDENENRINIKVQNIEQFIKSSDYNDDYLKDEEEVAEEKLYNGNGIDEYLVTYTYQDLNIADVEDFMVSNINANLTLVNGENVTNDNSYQYGLGESQGNVVSLKLSNETEEVSKAYSYINYKIPGKYETEISENTVINVSYKDIIENLKVEDVQNVYVSKDGDEIETDDIYYKRIEVSKETFDKILGETGEIRVKDLAGNELGIINNELEVNDSGNMVLNIEGRHSKLAYEVSKPVLEGNLIIKSIKAIGNLSIDKPTLMNMSKIKTKSVLKANFDYVDDQVDVETKETEVNLLDTKTEAKIKLDRNSLSTLSLNENVEIRVELNNANVKSDIYGHSVFEIELPEYIESLEITNTSILFGEGLNITEIVAEGRVIRITVDGVQEGINTGTLSNGTNIVLNANIKVNLYSPAKSEKVKLRFTNDEATNYGNNAEDEFEIKYSAPTGLVAVNCITGYRDGAKVESIRQGKKVDYIDIYTDSKVATEELIIMNNFGNNISNISILGRFPFKDVKDILSGENLGTTLTPKILSGITADARNREGFKVYYSEKGDATEDLTDELNGWIENPENLENMKSYLIVPINENYEMEDIEVLRFTYQYEVPGNLNHNENIFATYMVNYQNNNDELGMEENEIADLVGITTGEGPELDVEIIPNKEEVKEYEELEYTIKIKNIGKTPVQDVVADFPIPVEARYVSYEVITGNVNVSYEMNNDIDYDIDEEYTEEDELLEENDESFESASGISQDLVGGGNILTDASDNSNAAEDVSVGEIELEETEEEVELSEEELKELGLDEEEDIFDYMREYVHLNVAKLDVNSEIVIKIVLKIEEVDMMEYSISEDDTIISTRLEEFPEVFIELNGKVNAKDLGKELRAKSIQTKIKQAEFEITKEKLSMPDDIQKIGAELNFRITVTNKSINKQNNIIVTQELPDELEYVESTVSKYNSEQEDFEEKQLGTYDEGSKRIIWNIDELEGRDDSYGSSIILEYKVIVKDFNDGVTRKNLKLVATVKNETSEEYRSNTVSIDIAKAVLVITQITDNNNVYVKPGDIIKYTFIIKNEGEAAATNIELTDIIPTGMILNRVVYFDSVGAANEQGYTSDEVTISGVKLEPGEEAKAEVEMQVSYENTTEELTATNYGVVTADNVNKITTNSITHIIEGTNEIEGEINNHYNPGYDEDDDIVQTYKIRGIAWEDINKDGKRDNGEGLLENITVKLINSDTGAIQKTIYTNSLGEYIFSGIFSGKYMVVFEFDTSKYMVTTYHKEGISSNVNSDAISTRIEQDGKVINGAITDVIEISNQSISGIDLGLALAQVFDLKIDKTITKVTVQTNKGTTTENYKNVKLAKTEIASKNVSGAVVFVEYEIKVSNDGEVEGYAKKIIDYIPKGMKFNSSLESNSNWYTGSDGNLYSTSLENTKLAKGESKTLKLVLTKNMTTDNTGISNNQAEIFEDYNIYGISDNNSVPANKVQGENDISSADAVILIKTGETFIYISVVVTTMLLGIIAGLVIYNQIESKKRKVGV